MRNMKRTLAVIVGLLGIALIAGACSSTASSTPTTTKSAQAVCSALVTLNNDLVTLSSTGTLPASTQADATNFGVQVRAYGEPFLTESRQLVADMNNVGNAGIAPIEADLHTLAGSCDASGYPITFGGSTTSGTSTS
jgi:hypothetical protein